MPDREKVIRAVDSCFNYWLEQHRCLHPLQLEKVRQFKADALALLKEHKNEYENGFNDAMLGKQELMYEGTDGKWHKKDW